jgi:hypothetical protein
VFHAAVRRQEGGNPLPRFFRIDCTGSCRPEWENIGNDKNSRRQADIVTGKISCGNMIDPAGAMSACTGKPVT